MDKILIIGSEGQLGTELTLALQNKYKKENIITSDILKEGNGNNTYEILDVTNLNQLLHIIEKHSINQVYLLAAILSAKGQHDPERTWNVNMGGILNVLKACLQKKIKKVFWPSSIAVFGPDSPKENTPQETIMNPNTIYGISKVAGEKLCAYYFMKYGIDIRSIRYPGLIGHNSLGGGGTTDYAIEIFHQAAKGQNFTCFLKPDTFLPMMYMPDAINATIMLMEAPAEKISIRTSYNISGMSISPEEIKEAINKRIPGFEIEYKPDYRQEIADSWPKNIDDTYAQRDWNWKPAFGLERMAEDMLKNLSNKIRAETLG